MKDTLPSEVAATVYATPQLETLVDARRHGWASTVSNFSGGLTRVIDNYQSFLFPALQKEGLGRQS